VNFKNLTKREIALIIKRCHFTIKERQFFDMRCEGYTLHEIADKTYISESTADRLSRRIKGKIEKSSQKN